MSVCARASVCVCKCYCVCVGMCAWACVCVCARAGKDNWRESLLDTLSDAMLAHLSEVVNDLRGERERYRRHLVSVQSMGGLHMLAGTVWLLPMHDELVPPRP